MSFLQGCDREVITQVVLRLKPLQMPGGDYVCHKGDLGLEM